CASAAGTRAATAGGRTCTGGCSAGGARPGADRQAQATPRTTSRQTQARETGRLKEGAQVERRLAVLAGRYRQALTVAVALVLASGTAAATPKNRSARATFDRAVKAYARGSFKQASDLFARSYKQESDPDALFGWAQAERKLGHCDKAVELYERL